MFAQHVQGARCPLHSNEHCVGARKGQGNKVCLELTLKVRKSIKIMRNEEASSLSPCKSFQGYLLSRGSALVSGRLLSRGSALVSGVSAHMHPDEESRKTSIRS